MRARWWLLKETSVPERDTYRAVRSGLSWSDTSRWGCIIPVGSEGLRAPDDSNRPLLVGADQGQAVLDYIRQNRLYLNRGN